MKNIVFITLTFLTLSLNSIDAEAKKAQGQIFYQNDTVDVTFLIPCGPLRMDLYYYRLQNGVEYIDQDGKKNKLLPNEAIEFRFQWEDKIIRMYNFKRLPEWQGGLTDSYIFLKLETDGSLMLFNYFPKPEYVSHSTPQVGVLDLWRLGYNYYFYDHKKLSVVPKKRFQKFITQYFSSCPELVKKIKEKRLYRNQLPAMVSFFNSNCQ